ncbi:MAG: long-subunit fatty acid transport protein, partial [Myxococcota bacterium]
PDYRTTQSGGGLVTKDRTAITFIEVSPGLAFHGKRWSLGFGYRITIASLQRSQIIGLDSGVEFNNFELDLAGIDFKGLRIGFQFQPVDGLDIGFVYRHKIQPILKGDTATFLNKSRGKTEMDVTLPSRLGLGIRGEIPLKEGMYIAVETDIEYAFQSQNEFSDIDTTKDDGSVETIKSFFNWQDALTLRLGLEVGVIEHLRLRAGYVFDEQVTNKSYASAFGTPPADTHTGTFGAGWDQGPWEVNVAYAYRSGSYDVNIDDIQARTDQSRGIGGTCLTCSGEGTHEIDLHGFYLDFSYNWE